VKEKITKAYLLADPQRAGLKITQTDAGASIALPPAETSCSRPPAFFSSPWRWRRNVCQRFR
jgi:hypothetical protein